MEYKNNNIVSIVVVSCNSSAYIVDTLNSILNQHYSPIDLIISDDHSNDDTIPICQEWLNEHKKHFFRSSLIVSDKNTGVSANCNRGEKKAIGRWVKLIAADDVLAPNAIGIYVDYMLSHPNIAYLFGKIQAFGVDKKAVVSYQKNMVQYNIFNFSPHQQYKCLMVNEGFIPAPSFFYNKKKNDNLNIHNDESIPMLEDWPKWINITKKGEKLYFFDQLTVFYRIHDHSRSSGEAKFSFTKSQMLLYTKYQFKYNLVRHPRTSWIKYVKYKQYLTNKPIWNFLERFGRIMDKMYCKIRHSNIDDWENMENAINHL
jgi:alpha-1,3-rhamnosyltransferase